MKQRMSWRGQNEDGSTFVEHDIRLICTDKGTHPSREIGVLTRHSDDDDDVVAPTDKLSWRSNAWRNGRASARVKDRLSHEGKGVIFDDVTWRLRCPTCRREIQWRLGRAIEIVDTLVDSGVSLLDVSRLPATLQ